MAECRMTPAFAASVDTDGDWGLMLILLGEGLWQRMAIDLDEG